MLRKGFAFAALSLCAVAAVGTSAKGQQVTNPWEPTLGGSASNGPDFNGVNAALNVGVGYYLTDRLEVGGRQSLTYSDIGGGSGGNGSALNASTAVFLDYHFKLGEHEEWQPYIGGNIGFVYGDTVNDSFEAGPEGGVKYYVNANTFIQASVQYQFFFDKGSDATEAFSDGQFIYGLGIGFRF